MRWITAQNLEEWANLLTARTVFPGLIADLITASASSISAFRFPSREKGQVRGFDGVLDAVGAPPFVPDGSSIWEFGVGADFNIKADGDFRKRTKEIDPELRKNMTFVFATPRTWDKTSKQITDWLIEKRGLGAWKEVLCIDGVAIEHWLDLHPAVASNYARFELGITPATGASSLQEFWNEFSTRFEPTLVEDVLLAGREAQAAELLLRLAEGGSKLAFAADSADEVIAFVVAAIRRAVPETRAFLESRAIVVDSSEAAKQLANRKGLIFLPRGQARPLIGLLAQAGPTVISAGADEQRSQHDVLIRPTSSELAKAFTVMGIPESEGYQLARSCGRSLAVLARQRPSGTAEAPEWIKNSDALLPAILAGAWKPSLDADMEVLKSLGGRPTYEEVEAPLRGLTRLKDPPLDRVGDLWAMRSSVDAFIHLGHLIGSEHLARFAGQAKAVFSHVSEPPKAEQLFRSSSPEPGAHSRWLREGMMTTLLHMAALHGKANFVVTGSSPQNFVDEIVRGLPNLSADHRLLESLRDQLPLLAEAAPIPFLEALEQLLEGDASNIKPIFSESDDFFAPGSAHTSVLRALELLAWDERRLLRVAVCLAKLAAIDPGGKLSNRPINSLRDILLTWAPHTNAPSKQRIGVLTRVLAEVPSIAWPLLVKLLPRSHDTVTATQKPGFAEASPGGAEVLTFGVVWATQAAVVKLAVEHAEMSTERWQTLIGAFSQLQPESFEHLMRQLERVLEQQNVDDRFSTWDALRKETNRHHVFGGMEWSLKGEALNAMDALVAKFKPDQPLLINTWLFDDWMPDVPGKRSSADPMLAVRDARTQALKNILASQGVSGLAILASRVKLPLQMADSFRDLALNEDDALSLVTQFWAMDGEAKRLAVVLVAHGVVTFGPKWVERVRQLRDELSMSAEDTANLFSGLADNRESWDVVASFGLDVDNSYWRQKHAFGLRGTPEDTEYAVARYVSCGRALAAIEATHPTLKTVPTATLLSLLNGAVPEINAMTGIDGGMLEYYVEHLFNELYTRHDIARDDLARMEFMYLPLVHRWKRPLTLHKMLIESPEFFITTMCTVFKAASGEAPVLSEQEEQVAVAGYELLNGLTILPGQVGSEIDFASLRAWSDDVRQRALAVDRSQITDSRIGHMLAHAPTDTTDQAWPHKAIRQLIEHMSSDALEDAVRVERFNMRGVYTKGLGEGGKQERALAAQAEEWARAAQEYPRTTNMLRSLADMWSSEAARSDARTAQEALRW